MFRKCGGKRNLVVEVTGVSKQMPRTTLVDEEVETRFSLKKFGENKMI